MMKNPEETIGNLIDKQEVSFISSVDENGYPNTKAMYPPYKRENIKTIYWHTNSPSMRIKQYRSNPKACVYFFDKQNTAGVMLIGKMEILDDIETKKEVWKDNFSHWYKRRDGWRRFYSYYVYCRKRKILSQSSY